MINKFYIIKQGINLKKLNEKMKTYEQVHGEKPYIFMETFTMETFFDFVLPKTAEDFQRLITAKKPFEPVQSYAMYHGARIYWNNDLNYGEVELR